MEVLNEPDGVRARSGEYVAENDSHRRRPRAGWPRRGGHDRSDRSRHPIGDCRSGPSPVEPLGGRIGHGTPEALARFAPETGRSNWHPHGVTSRWIRVNVSENDDPQLAAAPYAPRTHRADQPQRGPATAGWRACAFILDRARGESAPQIACGLREQRRRNMQVNLLGHGVPPRGECDA